MKFLKKLFAAPTDDKVTEKCMTRMLICAMCSILLCSVCLASTTWAWYTTQEKYEGTVIRVSDSMEATEPSEPAEPSAPTEPSVPTEPTDPTPTEPTVPAEPEGEAYQIVSGTNYQIPVEGNPKTLTFYYQVTTGTFNIALRRDANNYYGYFAFDNYGNVGRYDGVTVEKLDNGYFRVDFNVAALNKCSGSPNSMVTELYIHGIWSDANGKIILAPIVTEPSEPVAPVLELDFKAGQECFVEVTPGDYEAIVFDYKLETQGEMHLILRDPDWGKYYGDFTFDTNGLVWTYQTGITCQKLDNGYIRVTMILDELNRSGITDNRDNAPATIGVIDVFSWTTVNGHMTNIQLLTEKP